MSERRERSFRTRASRRWSGARPPGSCSCAAQATPRNGGGARAQGLCFRKKKVVSSHGAAASAAESSRRAVACEWHVVGGLRDEGRRRAHRAALRERACLALRVREGRWRGKRRGLLRRVVVRALSECVWRVTRCVGGPRTGPLARERRAEWGGASETCPAVKSWLERRPRSRLVELRSWMRFASSSHTHVSAAKRFVVQPRG